MSDPARQAELSHLPLGIFRLVLASLVFLSHAAVIADPIAGRFHPGHLGVVLFFTLSGVVIFAAYETSYQGRPGAFLINRALRIYPTLWASYLLAVFCILVFADKVFADMSVTGFTLVRLFTALTAIGGGFDAAGHVWAPLGAAWSIAVELKFYVAAAIAFSISDRWFGGARKIGLFGAGLVALAAYLGVVLTQGHQRFYGELKYAPFFVLGACLYYVFMRRDRSPATLGLAVAALFAGLHFTLSHNIWTHTGFTLDDGTRNMTAAAFVAMTVLMAWLMPRTVSPWVAAVDGRLGDLTYPLYLTHVIVISLVCRVAPPQGMAFLVVVFLLALAAAALMLRLVEVPVMRWRAAIRRQGLGRSSGGGG